MAYSPSDISVVLPVGTGSPQAAAVVRTLVGADPPPGEIVVVDDRVADDSLADLPRTEGVRVIANDGGPGPAAARNAGARAARGPLLLFVDADVYVTPDIFARLAATYGEGVDAVVGVEAELGQGYNFASRYKNLWMRYTYLVLPHLVDLFYTSCASIRREVFLAAGGFDERYTRPSVEDTAFGRELASRGAQVVLDKSIEVEHRKAYAGLGEVLRTGFRRGVALARCIYRQGRRGGGNRTSVPTSYIWALPLPTLFVFWAAWAAVEARVAAAGAAATLAAIYLLNIKWLAFLARRGVGTVLAGLTFLP
ncbi:MAG: glycosyltransferase, partial [Candidatus Coatesbacteria bacterium]